MKKIVTTLIAMMCFLGATNIYNVYANDIKDSETIAKLIQLNILDGNDFSNSDTVTREECLIRIMRAIGLNDEGVNSLGATSYYAFVDTKSRSYFGCASVSKIAYGEECVVDYETERTSHTLKNTDYFFFPDRDVTVIETLAFMVRCLETDEIDLNLAFEKAKKLGLVSTEDEMIQKPNSTISQTDFCMLLERFLQQKRYKYYDDKSDLDCNIDEEKSMTYLEFLSERQAIQ